MMRERDEPAPGRGAGGRPLGRALSVGRAAAGGGGGAAWSVIDPSRAVWVAVSVLIVTCPCALSLAAPALVAATRGWRGAACCCSGWTRWRHWPA
jgi:hypothetical protein